MSVQANSQTISNYLYKLVPSSDLHVGAYSSHVAIANTKFNTNIPFGMVMVIRRIRECWFPVSGDLDQTHEDNVVCVSELSENLTLTSPQATDPLALHTDIFDQRIANLTAAAIAESVWWMRTTDYLPPHPGVPTMAQQLNLTVSNTNIGSTTAQFGYIQEIYYELIQATQQLKDYLANRISLQRTS